MKKHITIGLALSFAFASASITSADLPERPEIPQRPEIGSIIDTFRAAQQELVDERRALADSLRDSTVDERREAIEAYQATNADRIALYRAFAEQIRDVVQNLPDLEINSLDVDRPEIDPVERPDVGESIRDLMAEFHAIREGLIQERLDLLANLREASDEERAAALADLREQNAELAAQQRARAEEIRDARQSIREDRRNN